MNVFSGDTRRVLKQIADVITRKQQPPLGTCRSQRYSHTDWKTNLDCLYTINSKRTLPSTPCALKSCSSPVRKRRKYLLLRYSWNWTRFEQNILKTKFCDKGTSCSSERAFTQWKCNVCSLSRQLIRCNLVAVNAFRRIFGIHNLQNSTSSSLNAQSHV